MNLAFYQIDSFTDKPFTGNPAAIVPLKEWLPDDVMQKIASEMNLSETAFFVPLDVEGKYHLRWFTPTIEVDLCGHATLASSLVLREHLDRKGDHHFETLSGSLFVRYREGKYELDLPLATQEEKPELLTEIEGFFNYRPIAFYRGRSNDLVLFATEREVRALNPDLQKIRQFGHDIIATAKGEDCDFVSRYFAPISGISEDPVTGSTHCQLAPFWAEKLGKSGFFARQVSKRGGEIWCRVDGKRVIVAGRGVSVMKGEIFI